MMQSRVIDEPQGPDLSRVLAGFKRRRSAFFITLMASLAVTLLFAVLLPATYKSESTILIEQQEIPQELVRSTVTSYADQRIEIITQRVMTSANLWRIVEKYDLYQDDRSQHTREYILNGMREDAISREVISAEVVDPRSGRPTEATIAFKLAFTYESPMLAQRVTNELTSLFLSENLKTRTQMAEQASRFLKSETQKLEAQVKTLEDELARFKQANFQALPELTDLNLRLLDRAEQALRENRLQRKRTEEQLVYLNAELAQIDPDTPMLLKQGAPVLSSRARLKQAKQALEQAQAKYAPEHPDVRRLESEIALLLKEVPDVEAPALKLAIYERHLASLQQRYGADHPDVMQAETAIAQLRSLANRPTYSAPADASADNPAYLQIKAQKEAAEIELESLREQERLLEADMASYADRIALAPIIEQQYQQLNRDYQAAVLKHAEVKAKQQEANLGRSLESEQKGERFTLIEPPLVPEEPHSPNRLLLAVLGVLVSVGLSVGMVILREVTDRSIRGRKDLIAAIGAPPLAIIPVIVTGAESRAQTQRIWWFAGAALASIGVLLVLFHVFVKPLDVTWYVALRKFGLM